MHETIIIINNRKVANFNFSLCFNSGQFCNIIPLRYLSFSKNLYSPIWLTITVSIGSLIIGNKLQIQNSDVSPAMHISKCKNKYNRNLRNVTLKGKLKTSLVCRSLNQNGWQTAFTSNWWQFTMDSWI